MPSKIKILNTIILLLDAVIYSLFFVQVILFIINFLTGNIQDAFMNFLFAVIQGFFVWLSRREEARRKEDEEVLRILRSANDVMRLQDDMFKEFEVIIDKKNKEINMLIRQNKEANDALEKVTRRKPSTLKRGGK